MDLEKNELRLKTIKAKKMMLLFSLLSIAMTFAGLTSAYIVSKARPDWLKNFDLPISFSISTLIIAISSLTIWLAKKYLFKNEIKNTNKWLTVTFLLGIFFVALQIYGFNSIINQGYFFTGAQSTVTTSFLYVLVILHMAHLFAGLIVLVVLIYSTVKNKYTTNKLGFELGIYFWHFLDILWVYLFLFFYFFG